MFAFFIFVLSFFSIGQDFDAVLIKSKFYLNRQSQYHFSNKDLIQLHLNSSPPFLIGNKLGELEFEENGKVKKVFILDKNQLDFFNTVKHLVHSSPHLNFKIDSKILYIHGEALPTESGFLVSLCERLKVENIKLNLKSDFNFKNSSQKSCLEKNSAHGLKKILIAHLSKNSDYYRSLGLGSPIELGWSYNAENKILSLNNLIGSLSLGLNTGSNQEEYIFHTSIAKNSPIDFETGVEVGVKNKSTFTTQPIDWKKATTSINVNLLDGDFNSSFIDMTVTNTTPLSGGDNPTFNSNKFTKKINISHQKWVKIFEYSSNHKSRSQRRPLGLSFLGSSSKNKSQNIKEIWVLIYD